MCFFLSEFDSEVASESPIALLSRSNVLSNVLLMSDFDINDTPEDPRGV